MSGERKYCEKRKCGSRSDEATDKITYCKLYRTDAVGCSV